MSTFRSTGSYSDDGTADIDDDSRREGPRWPRPTVCQGAERAHDRSHRPVSLRTPRDDAVPVVCRYGSERPSGVE